MLTKNEITALTLSPTKKDFVQIWNELLEVAGKLSERWDPTSTNESDPGIVILKALTGIADKLNYNIDKNTLEAFMPTAAQEESMRKLCDMLGYNIKYYRSAVIQDVVIRYHNPEPSAKESAALEAGLWLPKFTVLTNADKTISYFTTNQTPYRISATSPKITVECMEGQVIKCESINDNNVIAINQITDNNRFYLPEVRIAENGIFIYDAVSVGHGNITDGERWLKVDNLNTQARGVKVFKFGYDSFEGRPYIEFPEDYSELFGSGIFIYYTRTNGVNGNISKSTLTQLELPSDWTDVSVECFNVENPFATNTGANIETISQAYNNFKKTIGTFDTLVTCRDYMNKIYSLMDYDGKPYVSNALVTDIRNDLNRAITICSCDGAGIFYKEKPIVQTFYNELNKPVFKSGKWYAGSIQITDTNKYDFIENAESFEIGTSGSVSVLNQRWVIEQSNVCFATKLAAQANTTAEIDHFDLVLYPFKTYNQVQSNIKDVRAAYDRSFRYTEDVIGSLKRELEQSKVIAHKIQKPKIGHIVSINNYLKLNALVSTNVKLTIDEGTLLVDKIKIALANAFNMRELDFGEEIPFDSILEVIEGADSRIRIVSLAEPALYTTFSVLDGYTAENEPIVVEYGVASDNWLTSDDAKNSGRFKSLDKNENAPLKYFNTNKAKSCYNKLVLRNILAGRVPLFNYNTSFTTDFAEGPYLTTKFNITSNPGIPTDALPDADNPITIYAKSDSIYTAHYKPASGITFAETYSPTQLESDATDLQNIKEIQAVCEIPAVNGVVSDVALSAGEYIKFRAPNLKTVKTYPAYVNYHLQLNKELDRDALGAEGTTLFDLLTADLKKNEEQDIPGFSYNPTADKIAWQKVLDYFLAVDSAKHGETDSEERLVKEFTLAQKVSSYNSASTASGSADSLILQIPETSGDKVTSLDEILNSCGCMRIKNEKCSYYFDKNGERHECDYIKDPTTGGYLATLAWDKADPRAESMTTAGPTIDEQYNIIIGLKQNGITTPFITDISVFSDIQNSVNTRIDSMRDIDGSGTSVLPTECDWIVSFTFQYVPINAASLAVWSNFIQDLPTTVENVATGESITVNIPGEADLASTDRTNKLNFTIDTSEAVFWRKFGSGYNLGRYVETGNDRGKYLPFIPRYFDSLVGSLPKNLYLLQKLGQDSIPNKITNGSEYELLNGERLYIEYTPASTTEDGTSENLPPVTEQYGPGTIIRPQGFESALIDSSVEHSSGTSFAKEKVAFKSNLNTGTELIDLFCLGANEQIEIRELAKIELTRHSASALYLYKNFDCDILEDWNKKGTDGRRTYTLKDGEYIFYTDQEKAELAYVTNGTGVELFGTVVIPKCDKIDIASVLDTGLKDIPWKYIPFKSAENKIVFQEYQYVTLGAGDKIKYLKLSAPTQGTIEGITKDSYAITSDWTFCEKDVEYFTATAPDNPEPLPSVIIAGAPANSSGWEVSSVLELDVAPSNTQTLRRTDKVVNCLTVRYQNSSGIDRNALIMPAEAAESEDNTGSYPLSFKTNLKCRANSSMLSIEDSYSNPKNLQSIQLKLFADNPPSIVQTVTNRIAPYIDESDTEAFDFATWVGDTKNIQAKSTFETWSFVDLSHIAKTQEYDNALLLSANIIDNTYGIACIYVDNTSTTASDVWLEIIPGTSQDDFVLINYDETVWQTATTPKASDRLILKPGINCLRINKTCRFFIKAAAGAKGTLFFDDLRLVNIKKPTGSFESATHGLNLEKLQYFPILADNFNLDDVVDEATKAAFSKSIENAKTTLVNSSRQLIETEASESFTTLYNIKNDVTKICSFAAEDLAENIVSSFNSSSANHLDALITQRQVLATASDTGHKALDMINKTASVNQIQESLNALLTDLVNPFSPDIKTDLLLKLQSLSDRVRNTELSKDTLKDTMVMLGKRLYDSSLPLELRKEMLAKLIDDIIAIGKAEHQQYLNELIDSIQSPAAFEDNQKVLKAIADLKDSVILGDSSKILTQVTSLEQLASTENVNRMRAALKTLRNRVNEESEQAAAIDPRIKEDYINAINAIENTLASYEATILQGLSNNDNLNDLMTQLEDYLEQFIELSSATYDGYEKLDILAIELDIIKQERTRLLEVFNKLRVAQAEDYDIKYTSIITQLRLHEKLDSNSVPTFDSLSYDSISAIMPAILQMSPAVQNRHASEREFIIAELSELINSITQNDRVAVSAKLNNKTALLDSWLLKEMPSSISDEIYMVYNLIDSRLTDFTSSNQSVQTAINNVISAIGVSDILSEQLSSLTKTNTNDPIHSIIGLLRIALKTNNTEKIATLKQDLETIVNSADTAIKLVDERFNVVLSEALADIAKINKNSYVITGTAANLINYKASHNTEVTDTVVYDILKDTLSYEEELRDLLQNLFSLPDFVVQNERFNTIFQRLLNAIERATEQNTEVEPNVEVLLEPKLAEVVKCWSNLDSAILSLTPVKFMMDKLADICDLLSQYNCVEDRTELLAELVKIKQSLAPNSLLMPGIRLLEVTLRDLVVQIETLPEVLKETVCTRLTEEQLLRDIRALDIDRDFYYNVRVEDSLAIDLNESTASYNTLMNPVANYSTNNVNNSFVISKLDIDHLTDGIQLARSSRLL